MKPKGFSKLSMITRIFDYFFCDNLVHFSDFQESLFLQSHSEQTKSPVGYFSPFAVLVSMLFKSGILFIKQLFPKATLLPQ